MSCSRPALKRRPIFVVDAVDMLIGASSDGKVTLSALGSYLKRMDPAFTPPTYGHAGRLNMVRTYELLQLQETEAGGAFFPIRGCRILRPWLPEICFTTVPAPRRQSTADIIARPIVTERSEAG